MKRKPKDRQESPLKFPKCRRNPVPLWRRRISDIEEMFRETRSIDAVCAKLPACLRAAARVICEVALLEELDPDYLDQNIQCGETDGLLLILRGQYTAYGSVHRLRKQA